MGTPEFAVASLEAMVNADYVPVAVVTTPDKPAGRGLKVQTSAVKDYAMKHDLAVLQPDDLASPLFLNQLQELNIDVIVVVAFRKLPLEVLRIPRLAAFNLHASLLPQYRGAAPIQWAVINGETESGVTTFLLDEKIDTGKIIYTDKVKVTDTMSGGDLHDLLMERGSKLVVQTLNAIETGNYKTIPQSDITVNIADIKKAPKIRKETCKINWNLPVEKINNLIRGLSPYPGAFTVLLSPANQPFTIKILTSRYESAIPSVKPGTVETDGITFLRVVACDGYIYFIDVQLAGKRIMHIDEFLRGFKFLGPWYVAIS
jgi:methionyl-tRNA formyltransferase